MLCLVLQKENGQEQENCWETVSVSHGDALTRSIGEFPREEDVSILSQILMVGVPEKYYLSQKACLGNLEASRCPWKRTAGTSEESTPATGIVLNDQGGNRMDVTDDVTCTLRAEAHHPPCVMESAGFCTEHSADSRGIGYEEENLRRSERESFLQRFMKITPQDTRYVGPLDVAQTVAATYGTGGNNQPFVVEPTAFGVCSKDSNAMKSANPNSGFYKADTSRTLDGNGGNPTCNQGGIAIVEGNGSRPSHHGNGYAESDVMYTPKHRRPSRRCLRYRP